jgi:hypothetical protein
VLEDAAYAALERFPGRRQACELLCPSAIGTDDARRARLSASLQRLLEGFKTAAQWT